jgi:hypothetical protein
MSTTITLPVDLAPSLRERVMALLAEVPPVAMPAYDERPRRKQHRDNRCIVCHQGGLLGGHHGKHGEIEWIHRSCHRRLHRRESVAVAA